MYTLELCAQMDLLAFHRPSHTDTHVIVTTLHLHFSYN